MDIFEESFSKGLLADIIGIAAGRRFCAVTPTRDSSARRSHYLM
jgi:hypothetical protein